jgi:hypothetical protein
MVHLFSYRWERSLSRERCARQHGGHDLSAAHCPKRNDCLYSLAPQGDLVAIEEPERSKYHRSSLAHLF